MTPVGTRRRSAFTLIEVMAAILLTSIVIAFAVNFFFDLTDSTERATARTRQLRHGVALLDRIARDLESAYLLTKPEEMDPLDHPWFFIAESPFGGDGADRVRFISRNYRRRTNIGHVSDFATVTVMLREGETDGFELVRLEEPGMPYELAREFPSDDAEGLMLLGEGIRSFSMRFMGFEGSWQDEWDSTQLVAASALPLAVELEVELLDPGEQIEEEGFESFGELTLEGEDDAGKLRRRVLLPFRPIDLAALEEGGQTDQSACVTVAQCVNEVAAQPCGAFWKDACTAVLASNEPDTCIEEAEGVTDGLIDWCANGGDGGIDPDELGVPDQDADPGAGQGGQPPGLDQLPFGGNNQ